jgi:hypothetical protein
VHLTRCCQVAQVTRLQRHLQRVAGGRGYASSFASCKWQHTALQRHLGTPHTSTRICFKPKWLQVMFVQNDLQAAAQ